MSHTQITVSQSSEPFWAAVGERRLRLPWCMTCGKPHFPPRPFCPHCWEDGIEWRDASGRGKLYSYTIVRANPPSAFIELLPYVIGIVRLDEGVSLMSHIEGPHERLACDVRVEVTWKEIHGRSLPAFVVAEWS